MTSEGGPRVVVFLATIRWGYLWQRHQSLATAASERGPVYFVESQPRRLSQLVSFPLRRAFGRRSAPLPWVPPAPAIRLVTPSPWSLVSPRRWASRLEAQITSTNPGKAVHVVLYAPSRAYLELARRLAGNGATVTYDAVVDWANAPRSWFPPPRVHRREFALPQDWRVVSDNERMARDLSARLGRSVSVVPPAADPEFLAHQWPPLEERSMCIGWFGAVRRETDVELLCAASEAGLRVEVVGPLEDSAAVARLRDAGVNMLPPVPIQDLPARIDHWRVAVLAYRGPRSTTITPAKLMNALIGFRVAVRGISVPTAFASHVIELPERNDAAVGALHALLVSPGVITNLHPDDLSWVERLDAVIGEPS